MGGNRQIPLNIRIISATNRNLEQMVEEGKFREDLYYRLNIFEIHLPPLRERPGDIPLLVHYFINKYRSFFEVDVEGIDQEAMNCLCRYTWKGNIRELENVVQYMISMSADSPSGVMGVSCLPGQVLENKGDPPKAEEPARREVSLREMELSWIREALKRYGDTTEGKKRAAKELGISLATLYRRLNRS